MALLETHGLTARYGDFKALFGIDLICFGLFILSEAIRLVRGLWSE